MVKVSSGYTLPGKFLPRTLKFANTATKEKVTIPIPKVNDGVREIPETQGFRDDLMPEPPTATPPFPLRNGQSKIPHVFVNVCDFTHSRSER